MEAREKVEGMSQHLSFCLCALLMVGTVQGSEGFETIDLASCAPKAKRLAAAAEEYESDRNNFENAKSAYESAKSEYEGACNSHYGYSRNDDGACGFYGYVTQNLRSARDEVESALNEVESALSEVESALASVRRSCDVGGSGAFSRGTTSQRQIMFVQQTLKKAGYNPGPIDGVMGLETRKALSQFQRDRGLPITGKPDVTTIKALLATVLNNRMLR